MMSEAMSEEFANPYKSPASFESGAGPKPLPSVSAQAVSDRALEAFPGTRGWVLLTGWCIVLLGLLMGLTSLRHVSGLFAPSPRAAGEAFGSFLFSIAFAGAVFTSGILLIRYGGKIKHLAFSRSVADLDRAVEAQRDYWRFVGICFSVFLLLMFVILLAVLFGGRT